MEQNEVPVENLI